MRHRKLIQELKLIIISVLLTIGLIISCDSDEEPTQPSDGISKVMGRLTNQGGFQKPSRVDNASNVIEGATVTLVRVQADGSAEVVSTDSVVTDSSGEFVLETVLNGVSNLVVHAEKNSDSWEALVSAAVQHGATITAQPLNIETTAEADVYSRVVAHGESDRVFSVDATMQTDSTIALEIQDNSTATNDFAIAVEEMVQARNAVLSDTAVGATQAQLSASHSSRVQAQKDLEAALFAANGVQPSIEAAFENFYEAELNAYLNSGIDASGCAKAKETGGRVLIKNSNNFDTATRFAIERHNAKIKAFALTNALQEEFVQLGASAAELSAVANAGVALHSSIDASSNLSEMKDSFSDYHNAILTELNSVLSAQAALINSINATINGPAGLKFALETAIDASGSTQGVINAYLTFYHEVSSLVKSTLTMLGTAEVEAAANILILINMQAS